MPRLLLALCVLGLLGLIGADVMLRQLRRAEAEAVADAVPAPAPEPARTTRADEPARETTSGATLGPDAATRAAARARLAAGGDSVYLDSLLVLTDSIVRRWDGRPREPLTYTIVDGGPRQWRPEHARLAREAFQAWSEALPGLRFVELLDSTRSDLSVRWIEQFPYNRAGQTDLTWDRSGRVRRASIVLALRTSVGLDIPEKGLRSVAIHEIGHALGLPHSADSADVMFHATRSGAVSARDRATIGLLYGLPLGSIKGPE